MVFAIHSFDNLTHYERKSAIIAAGAQNSYTTKPIRDISGEHFDIINFTEEFPITTGQFGNELLYILLIIMKFIMMTFVSTIMV